MQLPTIAKFKLDSDTVEDIVVQKRGCSSERGLKVNCRSVFEVFSRDGFPADPQEFDSSEFQTIFFFAEADHALNLRIYINIKISMKDFFF